MNRHFIGPNQDPQRGVNLVLNGLCLILLHKGGRLRAAWIVGDGNVTKVTWSGPEQPGGWNETSDLNGWKN
jgi:hypothetical protein